MSRLGIGSMKEKNAKIFRELIASDKSIFVPERMNNPCKTIGDTTTLYCLLKGKIYEVLIDTEDLERLQNNTWLCCMNGSRDKMYVQSGTGLSLHRYLMNCPRNKVVDHINGYSIDNRKSNLRVVTAGENMLNKNDYKSNSTGERNIQRDGNNYKLQVTRRFADITIAIKARDKINEILDHYSDMDAKKR
jgi:hypothetical protein